MQYISLKERVHICNRIAISNFANPQISQAALKSKIFSENAESLKPLLSLTFYTFTYSIYRFEVLKTCLSSSINVFWHGVCYVSKSLSHY